jgi:hypothetical protein
MGHEDQESRRQPLADNRCHVAGEGLADDDEIVALANGANDHIRVSRQPRAVILDRQVHDDHILAPCPEVGLDEVPVPSDVAGAMDEDIAGRAWTGHRTSLTSCSGPEKAMNRIIC